MAYKNYKRASATGGTARMVYNGLIKGYKTGKSIYDAYKATEKVLNKVYPKKISKSRSKSKKQTKKQVEIQQQQADATNMSSDKMVLIKRKPLRRTKAKYKFTKTQQTIVGYDEGFQSVNLPNIWFTVNQFNSSPSSAYRTYDWPDSLWNFNPNRNITGNTNIASGAPGGTTMNVERVNCKQTFTSLNNTPQTVYVYYFLARQNCDTSPDDCWRNDLAALDQNEPQATTNVLTTTASTVLGGASVNFFGQYPNTKGELSKNWKIIRVKKFVLQAGDTKSLEFVAHVNRKVNKTDIDGLDAKGISFIAGLTISCMVLVQGAPILVTDVSTKAMTFSPTTVGVITTSNYTFSVPPEPTPAPLVLQKYEIRASGGNAGKILDEDGDEVDFNTMFT